MPKPKVFTSDELRSLREGIERARHPGSYEEGKWMVSHLNRLSEVTRRSFQPRVLLRDITLRTTEQMPGVSRTEDERRAFLTEIVKTGVPEVQTSRMSMGHPLEVMQAEIKAVKEINPACEVVYGSGNLPEHVERAARAGYDAIQFWSGPTELVMVSGAHHHYRMAWEGRDWRNNPMVNPRTLDEQLERPIAIIERGVSAGIKVSAGINLVSFASDEYIRRFSTAMSEAGAYEIGLYDGSSGMGPDAYAHVVRLVKECAPGCRVGIHAHNMFGLATANSLAAAQAGADALEVSVNGYCVASGQADLAQVAVGLEAMYGVPTGVDLAAMTPLARLGEEFTGHLVAWNHPITGPEVFNEGGAEIVVQELEIDPLIHWSIEPTLVGNARKWEIGLDSGPYTMWDKLDQLNIDVQKDHILPILELCKARLRVSGRRLSDAEIRSIAIELVNK